MHIIYAESVHEKVFGHMLAQECQNLFWHFLQKISYTLYIEICTVALYFSSDICQIQLPQKCLECQVPDYYPCSDIVTCAWSHRLCYMLHTMLIQHNDEAINLLGLTPR